MKFARWFILGFILLILLCVCSVVVGGVTFYFMREDVSFWEDLPELPDTDPSDSGPAVNAPPTQPLPELGYIPTFEARDCWFETTTERVSCGWLWVPEDRDDLTNTPWIQLAVAVIEATDGSTGGVPLVYLEGGPGGQALYSVEYYWLENPLTESRTVILIDQRGNGYSLPSLNCEEMESGAYEDEWEAGEACVARLTNEGVDLNQYNSSDSAADIRDLAIALGYSQVDLLGVSYGTRLAMTVMRDHPAVVRAVILDSIYPPNARGYTEAPYLTIEVFRRLFAGCAAHPACNGAYPDLEEVFLELVAELNDEPILVEFWDDEAGEYYDEAIDGDTLIYDLFDQMYSTGVIPYLPAFIYSLYDGDGDYAYQILDDAAYNNENAWAGVADVYYNDAEFDNWEWDISDAEGQFYTVECSEEIPFDNYADAERLTAGYDPTLAASLLSDTDFMISYCELWGVEPAPAIENQAVVSSIPTLIVNGTYDPATPLEWAYLALETLSNGVVVEFPGYGHGIVLDACGLELMVDFLDDPSGHVDLGCLRALPLQPDFVIDP
jgi:pimeloyl-ACP methyl ester carboxylesterase